MSEEPVVNSQAQPEEVVEVSFDLSRVTLDEILDVIDLFDKGTEKFTIHDNVMPLRIMRKCLVKGSRELTGADLMNIFQGFLAAVLGADKNSKN